MRCIAELKLAGRNVLVFNVFSIDGFEDVHWNTLVEPLFRSLGSSTPVFWLASVFKFHSSRPPLMASPTLDCIASALGIQGFIFDALKTTFSIIYETMWTKMWFLVSPSTRVCVPPIEVIFIRGLPANQPRLGNSTFPRSYQHATYTFQNSHFQASDRLLECTG